MGPPVGFFTKEFHLILIWVHFPKNSLGIFFTRKSFLKLFPAFKLEIQFHSHKKVISPKLETFAHLIIENLECAKFQKNQRTFFSHSFIIIHSFIMTRSVGGLGRCWLGCTRLEHSMCKNRWVCQTWWLVQRFPISHFIKEILCKFYKRNPLLPNF